MLLFNQSTKKTRNDDRNNLIKIINVSDISLSNKFNFITLKNRKISERNGGHDKSISENSKKVLADRHYNFLKKNRNNICNKTNSYNNKVNNNTNYFISPYNNKHNYFSKISSNKNKIALEKHPFFYNNLTSLSNIQSTQNSTKYEGRTTPLLEISTINKY